MRIPLIYRLKLPLVKIFFLPLLVLLCSQGYGQNKSQKFNLDFETNVQGGSLPKDWIKWGDYPIAKDSIIVYSGKFSSKITAESGISFGSIAYKIPSRYKGKVITLEGYMRLKNVANGFAGLMLRLDGNGGVLQFDNMQSRGISGTRDWQKYQITLPYHPDTETIFVAGVLQGNGSAWFDNFKVSVDGKDIVDLKEIEIRKPNVERDSTFDKGSNVVFGDLTEQKVTDLELLGRIWGFLKYHHPAIATGDYNWDYELFRFLPKYLEAETIESRNQFLMNWIASYGTVQPCQRCPAINSNAYLKPNFKWFKQYELSRGISKQLTYIQKNRFQGDHYYINFVPNVGNPKFKNEDGYYLMPYPDEGFRLLALFRYWNMIEYYFPYKHLTDKKWDGILEENIPKFINAKDELEYEIATLKLIASIQDTHANLWQGNAQILNWKGKFFAPVHLGFVENQLTVLDYYNPELKNETGLEVGDVITEINGEKVDNILNSKLQYYPASNYPTQLRDISPDMLRSSDSILTIKYQHENLEKSRKIKLYKRENLSIYRWYRTDDIDYSYTLLENNIGYITLKNIKEKDIPKIKKEFINTKGIIIDIRNYPSFFVPFALGGFFVDNLTPFVRFTVANDKTPGEFLMGESLKIAPTTPTFKGKLVVLVNELSQSQAEYTAMAFRSSPRCTIIGSTTAGADGNVSQMILPGGMGSMISGIGVHYPDGSETQRVGIVPDIEIKPTLEGIRNGKDELLEKAIQLINKD